MTTNPVLEVNSCRLNDDLTFSFTLSNIKGLYRYVIECRVYEKTCNEETVGIDHGLTGKELRPNQTLIKHRLI